MSKWISEQRALESPYQKSLEESEKMDKDIKAAIDDYLKDAAELVGAYPGDQADMLERFLTVMTDLRNGRINTPSALL